MRLVGADVGGHFTAVALGLDRRVARAAGRIGNPQLQATVQRAGDRLIDSVAQVAGVIELTGIRWGVNPYSERVSDALTRGSRLAPDDYPRLKAQGYRSLIDLTAEGTLDHTCGRAAGFNLLNIKTLDNGTPTVAEMNRFVEFVSRPENQPAYVHCEAGIGRTGIAVACYRIAAQGWSADDAVAEARAHGMRLPGQIKFVQKFAREYQRTPAAPTRRMPDRTSIGTVQR